MSIRPRRAVVQAPASGASRLTSGGHPAATFDAVFAAAAEDCDLPPLPAGTARAIALTRDPSAGMDDLVRAVAQEPVLAARVLKLARSAIFARRELPTTLADAVRVVGIDAVRDLLLAASLQTLHSARPDAVTRGLWAHAVTTAMAADELGVLAGRPRGGPGFIAGLFHDVGKLVFHLADPAALASFGATDLEREVEVFGRSHEVVSAALAFRWNLGREIADAIMEHHQRPLPPGLSTDIACADWIAYRAGHGVALRAGHEPPDADLAALDAIAERIAESLARDPGLLG